MLNILLPLMGMLLQPTLLYSTPLCSLSLLSQSKQTLSDPLVIVFVCNGKLTLYITIYCILQPQINTWIIESNWIFLYFLNVDAWLFLHVNIIEAKLNYNWNDICKWNWKDLKYKDIWHQIIRQFKGYLHKIRKQLKSN